MPIKREQWLQPLSRQHHYGLLLCWKIRKGLKMKIDKKRITKYTLWFYQTHLLPHFTIEEQYVFPLLKANPQVERALVDHAEIKAICEQKELTLNELSILEKKLQSHIRYEERVLFNEIQKQTLNEESFIITENFEFPFNDNMEDPFWLENSGR